MNALVKTVGWITSLFRSSGSVTVAVEWQYSSGTRRAAPGPAQLSASLWTLSTLCTLDTQRQDILNFEFVHFWLCWAPHCVSCVPPVPGLASHRIETFHTGRPIKF